jgi:RNA polymerase sigma-70 factor (ECF subfamily)
MRDASSADTAEPPTDLALLERIRDRDEAALLLLYDRYAGFVFTVALRIVGDRALAEEVMQDTFLRCWEGAATYRAASGRVVGWLVGIARNRAIDTLRSRQHQGRLREQHALLETSATSAHDLDEAWALQQTVRDALASLPAAQRHVVELACYGGLTQVEIAQRLGEPLGTIKTRSRTALERLRQLLRPLFDHTTAHGDEL